VKLACVIPARMGSSRFPGKALLPVRGLPMVEHVRRRAVLSRAFSRVVVATCDREIAEQVRQHGGEVMMTSPAHAGATDRVAEAAERLDCTHVVNLQGDEILALPSDLQQVAREAARLPDVPAWNAVTRVEHREELADSSIVKLLVSRTGRVLFCARDARAWALKEPSYEPARKSVGIMVYPRLFLQRFVKLERTPLETAEGIDQLRLLEHDLPLQTVLLAKGYPTINERREVALVEEVLDKDLGQQEVLNRVLAGAHA